MASALLLRGLAGAPEDRYRLDAGEEEALASVAGELVAFAVAPEQGAIALERGEEIAAAWSRDGAVRLAQLLPPAFATLAEAIRTRHQLPG